MTTQTRRTLCVDGNNLLIRAAKATEGRAMLSSDAGVPTAALLVFINTLSRYVREVDPDHLVVCWDGGRSTHRTALFEGYKASRADRGEEGEEGPFGLAKEFLTLAGFHHVEHAGVEADDLVAHYARNRVWHERVTILSGDKDFLQLLDGWVEQIRPGSGADERWTGQRVRAELGLKAEHIPFQKALTGDLGDNVPGVPGIGPKTAIKLLAKYDWDFERLLASAEPKILGRAATIRRDLALVDLCQPLPGLRLAPAPVFRPTTPTSVLWGPLMAFLERYQMVSVIDRLRAGTLWHDRMLANR